MIFSRDRKYIYVAVPKTGSRSIQQYLQEHDPTARFNEVYAGEKWISVGDRDEAWKIRKAMGVEYFDYQSFGFIRHPYSKIVSSYFFYRNGEPLHENSFRVFLNATWLRKISLLATNFKMLSAKVVPFKIWALVYPYKSNEAYFYDDRGNLLVNHIGLYERLGEEFSRILVNIKFPKEGKELPHINKSLHKQDASYFSNSLFRKLIDLKVKADLNFYYRIKTSVPVYDE